VSDQRLREALSAIDAANGDDPHTIFVRGRRRPKELAHAELVSEWIEKLAPGASEALRIAGRAHHLRRWEIPRADYPEGREGYLRWRRQWANAMPPSAKSDNEPGSGTRMSPAA